MKRLLKKLLAVSLCAALVGGTAVSLPAVLPDMGITANAAYTTTRSDYIYFDNSETKWDEVYAYWWHPDYARTYDLEDNDWGCVRIISDDSTEGYEPVKYPGTKMKQVAGTDIWQVRIPYNAKKIVFNSGKSDEQVAAGETAYNTSDIVFDHSDNAGQIYSIDMSSSPKSGRGILKTQHTYPEGNWTNYSGEYFSEVVNSSNPEKIYFDYSEDSYGNVTITKYNGSGGDVTIPSEIDGKSVTSIGDYAFESCKSLKSITIPSGVISIGNYAFYYCSALTSITIPSSVTSIGDHAFFDCNSLLNITIPSSVTSIGDRAFSYCTSLTSITIPSRVTSIGSGAFYGCKNLTNIDIPSGVTSIGKSAFHGCNSLTSITIPDSVTSIGDSAFYECSSLTSITIPDRLTSIGEFSFAGCKSLTSINIPNSVASIGNNAFGGCSSLISVTIPSGVASIGTEVFYNCSSLKSINVDDNNEAYSSLDGVLYNKDKTKLLCFPGSKKTISIPYSVTSIGDEAFLWCESLTSVTIPNSVKSIGKSAFSYCSSLTSIDIPSSVTSIEREAFYNCSSLASINIPDSVTSIGYYTFYGCKGLTSITIPNSVTSIGSGAFCWCENLTRITIPSGVTSIGNSAFEYCKSLTNIDIPSGVTSIANSAFEDCESLTSINIPSGVTSIGDYAFEYCRSLTSITIPNSVTSIGDSAFWGCNKLTSINIPDSVTRIGNAAFYICDSLKSITITNSITSIGERAFGYYFDSNTYKAEKVKEFTIYGKLCSNAESYARYNGFNFVCPYNIIEANSTGNYVLSEQPDKSPIIRFTAPKTGTYIITESSDQTFVDLVNTFKSSGAATTTTTSTTITVTLLVPNNKDSHVFKLQKDDGLCISISKSSSDVNVSIQDNLSGKFYWNADSQLNNYHFHDNTLEISNTDVIKEVFVDKNDPLPLLESYTEDVVIKDGVKSIGYHAFFDMPKSTNWSTGLERVYIPSSVTSIDEKAFTYMKYEPPVTSGTSTTTTTATATTTSTTTTTYDPAYYVEKNMDYITICGYKGSYAETYAKNNGFEFVDITLNNKSSVSANSVYINDTVTINGSAEYGEAPYTYAYYYKKSTDSAWTKIAGYSTATSKTFKPTEVGTYNVRVNVKDSTGKTVKKDFTVTVKAESPLSNNSAVSSASVTANSTVTLTGKATGGRTPYTYAYYYKKSTDSAWTKIAGYSTATSKTFKPTSAGTYTARVNVKDSTGKLVQKDFTVTVMAELTNKSTVSADSIIVNKEVTLTGKATGGTAPYTYAYYYKKSTDSSWTKIAGYSTATSKTFKPTSAGTYTARVNVKDSTGKLVQKDLTVTVKAELTNKSTVSAASVTANKEVILTGKATGGTAPYTYAYYYKKSTDSAWTKIAGYSTDTSKTFKPTEAGTYTARVNVKDSTGKLVQKDFTVTVKAAPLTNNSTVSVETASLDTGVKIYAEATGGTAPYKYAYYYKKTSASNWTVLDKVGNSAYSTNTTANFKPSDAGTYNLRVNIKDSTGTLVQKDFTVTTVSLANQVKPFHTLGVVGGFNEWYEDAAMNDDDGDGIYTAEITYVGEYEFKVRADCAWDYSWAAYESYYDRTQNSCTNLHATVAEGQKLIVRLDTTKVSDEAKANADSYVNDPDFDFEREGYDYWPVTFEVVDL